MGLLRMVAIPAGCALPRPIEWRPSVAHGRAADRVMTYSGTPCPDCGHDLRLHPTTRDQNLSICPACIWEEDEDRRSVEAMCERVVAENPEASRPGSD